MDHVRLSALSAGWTRRATLACLLFAAYLLAALLGYALMLRPAGVAVVWPPSGIMLAGLLLLDRRDWPAAICGGTAGNVVADLTWGLSPGLAILGPLANASEVLVAAWLVRRLIPGPVTFSTLRQVAAVVVGAACVANAATALLGSAVLALGAASPSPASGWFAWWAGDGLGQILVAPVILTSAAAGRQHMAVQRPWEAVLLIGLVAAITSAVMLHTPGPGTTLSIHPYMVIPVLMLVAIRLGPAGAAWANLVLAGTTLWYGAHAIGYFGQPGGSEADQVLQAYTFLAIAAVSSLTVAAVIAERASASVSLQRSEGRLRQIAEHIAEVFWIAEAGLTRVIFVSWAYERIWGRSVDALYERPESFVDAVHPADRERVHARLTGSGPPRTFDHEYRIVRPDGGIRHIWDRGFPIPVAPGERPQYVGIAQDITDRHQAIEQIRLLAQAVASSNEMISVTDLDNRFTFVNAAFLRTYGYSEHEVLGRTPALLQKPDQPPDVLQDILALSRTTGWHGTLENRCQDGRVILIDLNTSAIRDSEGETIGLLGVARDVTDRNRLEAELRQAHKMEAVGQLAGGVAHDFNNLLTVIAGYADELAGSDLDARERVQAIEEIRTAATRATGLTRQLLAFSRRRRSEIRKLDLRPVVMELVPMLRRLLGAHIEIVFDALPAPLYVFADPTQIEQLVLNLSINARDAMPAGGRLSIALATVAPGSVSIEVSDTGVGMDAAMCARVFEPFFTTKEEGRGTGLGLSTVHGIALSLGGTVTVDSSLGAGTTFRIVLPEHAGAVAPPVDHTTRMILGGTERILVVDDEASIRQLVSNTLERLGYTVLTARDPVEALRLADRQAAALNLVIADYRMPGGTGPDLARSLRETRPLLKMLFISGDGGHVTDDAVRIAGGQFLAKPFTARDLALVVRDLLDQP